MPRAEAIDLAWRRIGAGVEPFSAPDGGPLSRTVKLVLLPLVLRPSSRRELAAAVLGPTEVAVLDTLIADHGPVLRAAAAWLVRLRRAAEQRDGIGRDLLYPRAFELAVECGAPTDAEAEMRVAAALDDLVEQRGDVTPAQLRGALGTAERRSEWAARLSTRWAAGATEPQSFSDQSTIDTRARAVLDAVTAGVRRPDAGTGEAARVGWAAILDHRDGSTTGRALRADRWPTALSASARARTLGLTHQDQVRCPPLDGGDAAWPWDRSVLHRLLTMLQHTRDRSVLPDAETLIAAEIDRVTGPWQLDEEEGRAMLMIGTVLALGLAGTVPADTAAHRIAAGMRRRESWIARSQRGPVPEPDREATTDLARLGAELADPVGPYLRRLWVRLHGAQVRGTLPTDVTAAQSLLLGTVRSALLDGRSRIRAALSGTAVAG